MKENVLLIGATGKTGEQIYKELNSRKIKTTVFVRKESAHKLNGDYGKIIHGDVLNYKDVENAIKEDSYTDIIISLGAKSLKKNTVRSMGTQHIVNAMEMAKSNSRIHLISALGVGDSWSQLSRMNKFLSNVMLKNVIEDHHKQEQIVINSSYTYHILRPVGLKDGAAKGEIHCQEEGIPPSNTIMRADVAKFLVDSIIENRNGILAICQKK